MSGEPTEAGEEKRKHLEFLQLTITRMAANSFVLKGWSVTLIAALFAVVASENAPIKLVVIGFFPAIAFWTLDAYYLRLERNFVRLFKKATSNPPTIPAYCMDPHFLEDDEKAVDGVIATMFSTSMWPLHSTITLLVTAMTIYAWWNDARGYVVSKGGMPKLPAAKKQVEKNEQPRIGAPKDGDEGN